jgi:conjugal transfer ATP-binding protein TraC
MPLPFRIRLARSGPSGRRTSLLDDETGSSGSPALSPHERLFALGTRTLADLIAPAGAEIRRDHLQLDAQYLRALVVTGYPRTVAAGWLAPLVEELDLPLELSLHVRPLPSGDMVRALGLQIAKLESSRRVDVSAQRVNDPERDIALEDADRLRSALQRGDERVFSVSLYLLLRAPTRRALDDLTRRVETQLDGLLTHSRVALFEQERGFRSCLPEGRDRLLVPRNLDTSSLAITLPMATSSLVMERGVLYGVSAQTQSPIIIDPFDPSFDNYNLAVIAPSGSGKSYFTKLLALRHLVAGTEFLIIDPEDEYRAVAEAAGGLIVRLAASSPHRLNPLDLVAPEPTSPGAAADPLAHSIAVVLGRLELLLCAGAGPGGAPGVLDVYERSVLDEALVQTYDAAGITSDPATHERPAPLLAHLHAVLNRMQSDIAGRLAMRLRRHIPGTGSLGTGVFAGRTNVTFDQPFVVFHIRELPKELWPLAIHLISSHVWNTARRMRRQRLLVVDEAAMLLAHPSGGSFLADVARRARKYYLGLVTIWQKVGDLTGSEHGETILTNSDMKLLLKQSEEIIDVADARFRFTPGERRFLLGALKGEGLLLARGGRWPIKIESSPAEHRLATTNPRDLLDGVPDVTKAALAALVGAPPQSVNGASSIAAVRL